MMTKKVFHCQKFQDSINRKWHSFRYLIYTFVNGFHSFTARYVLSRSIKSANLNKRCPRSEASKRRHGEPNLISNNRLISDFRNTDYQKWNQRIHKLECLTSCRNCNVHIFFTSWLNLRDYFTCSWIYRWKNFAWFTFVPFVIDENLKLKIKNWIWN